jgi:hypothetical protein
LSQLAELAPALVYHHSLAAASKEDDGDDHIRQRQLPSLPKIKPS